MTFFRVLRASTCLLALTYLVLGCGKIGGDDSIGFKVGISTKGAVITTENISTEYGTFTTDVWVADADKALAEGHGNQQHYIDRNTVTYYSSSPNWRFSEDRYWLNDVGMCFWSWAPVDVKDTDGTTNLRTIGNSVKDNTGVLEFSYSLPTPTRTSDAENQKDILFAFNYEKHTEDSGHKDIVDVKFYHALSWVKFMVDYNDGNFDSELEIENIKLENIYGSAQCTFKPTESDVADKFDWSSHTSKQNIGQNYTIAGDFRDHPSSNCYVTTNEKAFMVIPQTTPDDAAITITFIQNDTPTPITVAFNGQNWKPGKFYTYRIKAPSLGNILIECIVNDWIEDGESYLE